MPLVVTDGSFQASQRTGFEAGGPILAQPPSSVGGSEIGAFNRCKEVWHIDICSPYPHPQHSTHSLASHFQAWLGLVPDPIPPERGSKAPSLGLIQQNSHPRCLFRFTSASLPHRIPALVWVGQPPCFQARTVLDAWPGGPPLGTPVPRQEAAPPWPPHTTHGSEEDAPSEEGCRAPQQGQFLTGERAIHCGELESGLSFKEQQCGQGHQLASVLVLGLIWKELQGGLPGNTRVPQLTHTHVPISLPHVNQQQPVVDEGAWPSGRGGLATTLCSWFGLPLRPPSIEKGTTPAAGIIAPESSLWREQFENPHLESQKDGTEQRCGPLSPLVWPGMHPPPSRADGGARSLPARAARMATMQQDLPELVDIKR